MNSPEYIVYNSVVTEMEEKYGVGVIDFSSEYQEVPASFPSVTIVESDNYVYSKMRLPAPNTEQVTALMYEVNVYSNKSGSKKLEAKSIMSDIDDAFCKLGFERMSCTPVPNLYDSTIYRITARYSGLCDLKGTIYKK